jgi:hypothetical protein
MWLHSAVVATEKRAEVVRVRIDRGTRKAWQSLADRLRDGNVSMTMRLAMSELA